MKRTLAALAMTVTLAACSSSSGLTIGFPVADVNEDGGIQIAEFDRFFDNTNGYPRFDDNDDGVLTRREFTKAMEARYETDEYFNAFDLNDDGQLSRREFVGGLFRMYDLNRNGRLGEDEFNLALEGLDEDIGN